jgi:hypothetical protein
MWVPPDFFESTHTPVSSREAGINVVIITEIVGNMGAKVFKCAAEGNISISNIDALSFRKSVVHGIFACCASIFRLPRFVGKGTEEGRADFGGIGNCLMVGELGNITCGRRERKLLVSVVVIIEELRGGEEYTFCF